MKPEQERIRKKQMEANAMAWFHHFQLAQLIEIVEVRTDRLFFQDTALQKGYLGTHGFGPFYDRMQFELTPTHLRRYDLVQNHRNWSVNGQQFTGQIGWRELEEPSAQIVVYKDWTLEFDYDFFSAVADVKGILGHLFLESIPHLLGSPKTNSCRVAKRLAKNRNIRPTMFC